MIVHPNTARTDDRPYIFAHLRGFSCSVCAPLAMTQADVEAFAVAELPLPQRENLWEAVDKSTLGLGGSTPNACNTDPDKRRHWFLMSTAARSHGVVLL